MIKEMLGAEEVGWYAVAVIFSDVWLFITVAITNSLFPAIIKAKEFSQELFEDRMIKLYRFLILISLIISIIIFLLSENLVLLLFGEQYFQTIEILQLYIWSIIFVFLNNLAWKWYIVEKLQKIAFMRLTLGAIVNIILNLFLIPMFGLKGAVYATLLSYSVATYFGNLISPKTMPNFKMQTYAIFTFYKVKSFYA